MSQKRRKIYNIRCHIPEDDRKRYCFPTSAILRKQDEINDAFKYDQLEQTGWTAVRLILITEDFVPE